MFPVAVVPAESIENMTAFLVALFEVNPDTVESIIQPCRANIILIPESSVSIVVTDKSAKAFKHLSQKHLFMSVKDIRRIQQRALQLGAQLLSSNHDDCMLYGPEKLIIHPVNTSSSQRMVDVLLASVRSEDCEAFPDNVLVEIASKPSRPSPIPSVECKILSANSTKFVHLQPNSFEPVPFETELFKGHCQFFLRSAVMDPHVLPFFEGKRTFEVQVQGRFKRQPLGEIYVGGALTEKMVRSFDLTSFYYVNT